jgi:transposase
MWTKDNRGLHERKGQRYPSDLTGEEWTLAEPHLPPAKVSRHKRDPIDRRELANATLYLLTTGCQWRQLPKGLSPRRTVHDYDMDWLGPGTLTQMHHALYAGVRVLAGKAAESTLADGNPSH